MMKGEEDDDVENHDVEEEEDDDVEDEDLSQDRKPLAGKKAADQHTVREPAQSKGTKHVTRATAHGNLQEKCCGPD